MIKYKIDSIEQLSKELIMSLIDNHRVNVKPNIERLHKYYNGQSDIKNRKLKDETKPNNKIASSYPSYIVDTIQGYFLGKPVNYKSEYDQYLEKLMEINSDNYEQNHNSRLSKEMSISGVAYELVYVDENSDIKFTLLDSSETFVVYDNSIKENPLFAVRYFESMDYVENESITFVDVYTSNDIRNYYVATDKDDNKSLVLVEVNEHLFDNVPIVEYRNNDEYTGDFEKVIDLIDAYDLAVSDTANNLEYFADSYLLLKNAGLDLEQVDEMKEKRVMMMEGEGDAKWLTKEPNIEESEAYKSRLKEDIHNFSFVPNLNDEIFGNATSGEALKYKLFGLENLVSNKERVFKEGLEKRIKLITTIVNLSIDQYDVSDISIQFTRNLPKNNVELSDLVVKLQGILPNETLIGLLPFVEDPIGEIAQLERENEDEIYTMLGAE